MRFQNLFLQNDVVLHITHKRKREIGTAAELRRESETNAQGGHKEGITVSSYKIISLIIITII